MNNDTFQWTGDFGNVPVGLYEIFWKSGGSSLAAIGCLYSGERWIAPVNWTHKDCPTGKISEQCNLIERLVLIKSPTGAHAKKEWEIVECYYEKTDQIAHHDVHNFNKYCLGFTPQCTIHSVKRVSDGQLFTVGDINEYPTGLHQAIKEFKISEETPSMMLFRTDEIWSNLSIAEKAHLKKGRLEVLKLMEIDKIGQPGTQLFLYCFTVFGEIKQDKLISIKAAIERVLNDEGDNANYSISLIKEKLEIFISDPELMPKKVVVNGFEYIIR